MSRIENFPMTMDGLNRQRRVSVYLPSSYDIDENETFSVLYMHDGQNLFFDHEAHEGVSWGVKSTLDRLEKEGRGDLMVVALDHDMTHRSNEFSPFPLEESLKKFAKGRSYGGEGALYAEFFAQQLKPYIDLHYRTKTEPAHTSLAGSSLGAFISLYIAFQYPHIFGKVGLFSTALWFSETQMMQFLQAKPAPMNTTFFLSVGQKESQRNEKVDFATLYQSNAHTLQQLLLSKCMPPEKCTLCVDFEGRHDESSWAKIFVSFMMP